MHTHVFVGKNKTKKYEKLKLTLKAEHLIFSVQFQLSSPNSSFLLSYCFRERLGGVCHLSEFSLAVSEFYELTLGMAREEIP